MSVHQTHLPEGWARPPGFSHAMSATGRTVWIAGQLGRAPGGGLVGDDMAEQTRAALANIVALLAEAGARPEHLVRLGWYVTSLEEYRAAGPGIASAWRDTIGRHFPTVTLLQVSGLVEARAKVEIEAVAMVP